MDAATSAADLPPMERAIKLAGSEDKLGKRTGYSQVAINKAKRRGHCSANMAIAIHRAFNGEVPATALCPGVWNKPEDVPLETEAQGVA